ncbi:MAG: PQQ-binding-like beta-propeller repeat protein [Planctomycetaceae bacterium]
MSAQRLLVLALMSLSMFAAGCEDASSKPVEPSLCPAELVEPLVPDRGDEARSDRLQPVSAEDASTPDRLKPVATNEANELPASSWPSFRNGHLQTGVATSELPEQLELLWQVETEHGVAATAAVVGEHVYVGTIGGDLLCLDRRSGKEVWKYRSIEDDDPNAFAPAFKAAPLATIDSVYLGDEDGFFHAVDRATGRRRWMFETEGEVAGCASIVEGKLLFGSHDTHLYCLDAATGKLLWKFQTQDRVNCSTAIVENYTFVAGCDAHLRVIDIAEGKEVSDIDLGSYLIASPAVVGNMLYVGNYGGEVLGVDWKNEKIVWRYKQPDEEFAYHASCAVIGDKVLVGCRDKNLHCIDRLSGESIWKFATKAQIDSSPVVVGNRVFFGSNDRNLYAVSLADGKELWKHDAGRSVTASPAVGEGVLVIGAEGSRGNIFCFGTKD